MFTAKDKEQLQKDLVSGSKSLDGETHRVPQIHTPGKSLQTLQRNLGNSYLQASNPTITQIATDVNGLRLQRACACGSTCTNCATKGDEQRILQPKLMIGSPNDMYEQEADHVADQIMQMPEPTIQRQMGLEEDEEEGMVQREVANSITPLQRDSTNSHQLSEAPPSVHEVLQSSGQPLDSETRAFMEPRFRHDFSRVRVHTGADAERSARDVNANAYTVRHNIVFGAGQFTSGTNDRRRLIAHELTHVIQQETITAGSVIGNGVQENTFPPADSKVQRQTTDDGDERYRISVITESQKPILQRQNQDFPPPPPDYPHFTQFFWGDVITRIGELEMTCDDRRERSFWIFWNERTKTPHTSEIAIGDPAPKACSKPAQIELGPMPRDRGHILVAGWFHNHPPVWPGCKQIEVGPSKKDKEASSRLKLPGLVQDFMKPGENTSCKGNPRGTFFFGPSRRPY